MLFSSMVFLWIFLPVVFCGYHLIQNQYKNIWLLTASLVFYAWGEPVSVFLLLVIIAANYGFGILIDKMEKKKVVLSAAVIFNLSVLAYFKYLGPVLAETYSLPGVVLPLGISFYIFQSLSYVIDFYRGRGQTKAPENIFHLAVYISFFPQLVAGPIVKYQDVEKQITDRICTLQKTAYGIKRFIYGLGKKVVISNSIASVVDAVYANPVETLSTSWVWIGAALYTLQIYYDFSGYSDMAIGLGKMFGFDFMENFNYPYLSKSIREFWRRWHISLSSWFRDYVYIPLGGNQKGRIRTYINLWIVFVLTGIWHGASLNFLAWGIWHGFFIFIERLGLQKILDKNRFSWFSHIYTLVVVIIGWAIFRCDSWNEAWAVLQGMFRFGKTVHPMTWYNVASVRNIVIIAVAVLLAGPLQSLFVKLKHQFQSEEKFSVLELGMQVFIFACSIMILVSGSYNPFIYFKF